MEQISLAAIKDSDTYKRGLLNVSFFICIALILYTRVLLFLSINIDYIDSDQPFIWAGAKDYSQGLFYEPRFYGQNYNTFMEGLFAVPFMWLGMPVYYAVPLATHLIFLFPFLFTACYLFFKQRKASAVLTLATVMCMPAAYDIMSSLPRGFVPGLFFSSFFVISLLAPLRRGPLALNILMALLGYFVSANSIMISLPVLFYLFLQQPKSRYFYLCAVSCLLLFIPLYYLFDGFYKRHPSYIIYAFEHDFSFKYFLENISDPNRLLAHVSFFVEENCLPLLAVLLCLGSYLFKHNRKAFYAFLVFLALFLLSLSTSKSRDGVLWPWYSYSRLYLGLPFLIYLLAIVLPLQYTRVVAALLIVTIGFSAFKIFNFKKRVAYHTDATHWNGVHLVSLGSALEAMRFYKDVCKKQEVDFFLISNGFWLNTFLDYGGPAAFDDFPATQETNSERRYWVREGNKNKVISKFVLLSRSYKIDQLMPSTGFELQKLDDYGLLLVKNNTLKMGEFIRRVKDAEARD